MRTPDESLCPRRRLYLRFHFHLIGRGICTSYGNQTIHLSLRLPLGKILLSSLISLVLPDRAAPLASTFHHLAVIDRYPGTRKSSRTKPIKGSLLMGGASPLITLPISPVCPSGFPQPGRSAGTRRSSSKSVCWRIHRSHYSCSLSGYVDGASVEVIHAPAVRVTEDLGNASM
ncbi:hypothetical protein OG21DRAFT_1503909 [Imleria badia]|nr:hypothetical protein OG21DRAFT_1503909 [Imleria badia]